MIVYFSRSHLRNKHSYGYYRFFAFEFILLLIVTNLKVWFNDPFSLTQILSWLSLLASLYLAISGFGLLGVKKAADTVESTVLIDSGIYGKIRHPLYSSLLFLALGAFLKKPELFPAILLFGAAFTTFTTARTEESLNTEKFGERYEDYAGRTKMFVPYLF